MAVPVRMVRLRVLSLSDLSRRNLQARKEMREKAWQLEGWSETVTKVCDKFVSMRWVAGSNRMGRRRSSQSLWIRTFWNRSRTLHSNKRIANVASAEQLYFS